MVLAECGDHKYMRIDYTAVSYSCNAWQILLVGLRQIRTAFTVSVQWGLKWGQRARLVLDFYDITLAVHCHAVARVTLFVDMPPRSHLFPVSSLYGMVWGKMGLHLRFLQ